MDLADGLSLILVDQSRQLRVKYPGLYLVVDATKARPGWVPFAHRSNIPTGNVQVRECRWCGDDYPIAGSGSTFCCRRCERDYVWWTKHRHDG